MYLHKTQNELSKSLVVEYKLFPRKKHIMNSLLSLTCYVIRVIMKRKFKKRWSRISPIHCTHSYFTNTPSTSKHSLVQMVKCFFFKQLFHQYTKHIFTFFGTDGKMFFFFKLLFHQYIIPWYRLSYPILTNKMMKSENREQRITRKFVKCFIQTDFQ